MKSDEMSVIPSHVAIIMDGNGRWAQAQGQVRGYGHKQGAANVKEVVRCAAEIGIQRLTLYAFSTENWRRSALEVNFLMRLFSTYIDEYTQELIAENIQAHVVGDVSVLSRTLREKIERMEALTATGTGLVLNLAINYGGRAELVRAMRRYATECLEDGQIGELTETDVARYLYPSAAADVDLLIRTGGERRISNFLLWQVSYAEMYFSEVLWPEFGRDELAKAVSYFAHCERRFGAVKAGD